jgi:hypothetical protein
MDILRPIYRRVSPSFAARDMHLRPNKNDVRDNLQVRLCNPAIVAGVIAELRLCADRQSRPHLH